MINIAWSQFVQSERKAKGLTRRRLAEMAGIDPSYVTLIERDGYVPRKEKVRSLAQALGVSLDQALLSAGYAPSGVPVESMLETMGEVKAYQTLEAELRNCIMNLMGLSAEQQRKVAELLNSYLKTLKGKEQATVSSSNSLRRSHSSAAL